VDGHAKSIKVVGGWMNGAFNNKFLMPANTEIGKYAYCADPDAIIVNGGSSPDGTAVPSPIACGAIAPWIRANFPVCAPGQTSDCFFAN
jgi:hypothetical protein